MRMAMTVILSTSGLNCLFAAAASKDDWVDGEG